MMLNVIYFCNYNIIIIKYIFSRFVFPHHKKVANYMQSLLIISIMFWWRFWVMLVRVNNSMWVPKSTKLKSITSSNLFLFCSTIWNYQEEVLLSQAEESSRVLEGSVVSIARDSWWLHLIMKNMTGLQAIFKPFILKIVQEQTLWIKGLDSNNNNHITIQKNSVREMLRGAE
jgi:hypothetical protein